MLHSSGDALREPRSSAGKKKYNYHGRCLGMHRPWAASHENEANEWRCWRSLAVLEGIALAADPDFDLFQGRPEFGAHRVRGIRDATEDHAFAGGGGDGGARWAQEPLAHLS